MLPPPPHLRKTYTYLQLKMARTSCSGVPVSFIPSLLVRSQQTHHRPGEALPFGSACPRKVSFCQGHDRLSTPHRQCAEKRVKDTTWPVMRLLALAHAADTLRNNHCSEAQTQVGPRPSSPKAPEFAQDVPQLHARPRLALLHEPASVLDSRVHQT